MLQQPKGLNRAFQKNLCFIWVVVISVLAKNTCLRQVLSKLHQTSLSSRLLYHWHIWKDLKWAFLSSVEVSQFLQTVVYHLRSWLQASQSLAHCSLWTASHTLGFFVKKLSILSFECYQGLIHIVGFFKNLVICLLWTTASFWRWLEVETRRAICVGLARLGMSLWPHQCHVLNSTLIIDTADYKEVITNLIVELKMKDSDIECTIGDTTSKALRAIGIPT